MIMKVNLIFNVIFLIITGSTKLLAQDRNLLVNSDFPGGNIIVDKIQNDTVWLKPDLRDTRGYWFYWYFKISGVKGKTINFQFPKKPVFGKFGPAYSINNDNSWNWYSAVSHLNHGFTFTFSNNDTCAYFSIAFPYTQKNLYDFLGKLRNRSALKMDTLCLSRKGRAVEQIHIMPVKNADYKVLITARNHACEMTTDYVLEGIIRSVLNERNLQFLRDHVEFCFIPFVDKDGVEDGDQGKNRKPHDHNRDYNSSAIYPEVRAIMRKVPKWSNRKLKIVMDLHCPYLSGNFDNYIYFVGGKNKNNEKEQITLSRLVEKNCSGELKFYNRNFLKFGTGWNSIKNYSEAASCEAWGATIPGIACSTTLEFPYANVSGVAVSRDNARVFGRALAYAMKYYLIQLYKK